MSTQLFKPKYRVEEVLKEIRECLEVGWTGLGFKTEIFEKKWKKYTNFKNAHFVASNTAGLQLAVKVLKDANKWKDGDEIITTPLTFVSSNHAILYNNLKAVFADVDDQLCLNPANIESKITRKTRAVMFVGIGGNVGQYKKIKEICEKNGLKFILDAAHMAGTRVLHNKSNSLVHVGLDADVSVFSFQSVKNLPTADGGMVCFMNKDYDVLARKLSWLGIDKDTFNRTNSKGNYKWDYDVVDVGYKSHGNSVMASMGIVALRYLDEDNERRRKICEIYDKGFAEFTGITVVKHNQNCLSSRHLYQIRVSNRDSVMEFLNANEIFPGVHYKDNTQYEMYSYAAGSCPNAASASQEIISLPLHLFLDDEDVFRIVDLVKKAVSK